ncbi:hypothetical protein [Spirillospora sp. NPDC048819]|uniref:hypothetical protein n=1 Tax=Spirillospora sp. NPDC048819 TaxID=3155268 RepID=UPI0033FA1F30
MRKITRKAMTATAAAAAAAAFIAVPASAAPLTYTVSLPGVTPPSPNEPLTGKNDGKVVAFNTTTGAVLECVDVGTTNALVADGEVNVGTGLSGTGLGLVTAVDFNNCTVNGQTATVTAQNLPWRLDATGAVSGGVTPGKLVGVSVHVLVNGLACEADFQGPSGTDGFIEGTHTNPANPGDPSELTLPFGAVNNLTAANVTHPQCPANLVDDGHGAALSGKVDLRGVNSTLNEGPTVS